MILKLTQGQKEEIRHLHQKCPTRRFADKFNVEYTASGTLDLLDRMGFVYKKPVLTPCKANVEKQEKFVEEYRELKNNLPGKDQIYFVDGVHPQHNTIANYGWIKKGKTKHLKTNNGRQRTNINGALNLATKQVLYVEDEQINAQTMIVLLNLNIIERLWHILKEQVVYNKFYQVFGDFKNAFNNFFENKVWLEKEFENILTDNFQIIKPNFSGSYLK